MLCAVAQLVERTIGDRRVAGLCLISGCFFSLRRNQSSENEKQYLLEIITCDPPPTYSMNNPDITVSNFMENSIGLKKD